jgi:hypothetical protein
MPYNPSSRKNLKPRSPSYGVGKGKHEITVTTDGWAGFQALAASHGVSCSELVERLGRGLVSLPEVVGEDEHLLRVQRWDVGLATDSHGRHYQFCPVEDAP